MDPIPKDVFAHVFSFLGDDSTLFTMRGVCRAWKQATQALLLEQAITNSPRQRVCAGISGCIHVRLDDKKASLKLRYKPGVTHDDDGSTCPRAAAVDKAISMNERLHSFWHRHLDFASQETLAREKLLSTGKFSTQNMSTYTRAKGDISIEWWEHDALVHRSPIEWLSLIIGGSCHCHDEGCRDNEESDDEDCGLQSRAFRRAAMVLLHGLMDDTTAIAYTMECSFEGGERHQWDEARRQSLTLESSSGRKMEIVRTTRTNIFSNVPIPSFEMISVTNPESLSFEPIPPCGFCSQWREDREGA